MPVTHLCGIHNSTIIEVPTGIHAFHTTLVESGTNGHLLKGARCFMTKIDVPKLPKEKN